MLTDLLAITGCFGALMGWAATACHAAHLLRTDPLTALANRGALVARLRRHHRHAAAVGLLLADLDGFKQVYDTHGHDTGNILLRGIARRMRAVAHPGELVVRLHCDEFAVLLGSLPSGAVGSRLAALRRDVFAAAIAEPTTPRSGALQVTASIGAAVIPGADADLCALLSEAGHAMYQAKRSRHCRAVPAAPSAA